jgi:hypothetical protein
MKYGPGFASRKGVRDVKGGKKESGVKGKKDAS